MNKKHALIAALACVAAPFVHAQINMGMVGDSRTDDYLGGPARANNNLAAYSWGQVLAETRGNDFNFGAYKSVNDGIWDTIRYSGYEYNYATSGAAASNNSVQRIQGGLEVPVDAAWASGSSYLSSQTAGLSTHIANGNVDTVFVGSGSNDFFYRSTTFDFSGNATLDNPLTIGQLDVDDISSSILAGVDTLIAAGNSNMLLALLPQGTAGGSPPEVLTAIQAVNDILVQEAATRGVAVVDMWGWTTEAGRVNPDGSINVGGLSISADTSASANDDLSAAGLGPCSNNGDTCALTSHASHATAEDGLHPNTLIQGLMANQVIGALNQAYGHNIQALSDQELLAVAGVSEVPVPGALWLFASSLLGLRVVQSRSSRAAAV